MREDNFNEKGELLCRKCGQYKTEDHFFNDKLQKYRHFKGTECKECQRVRKQKYWRTKEVEDLDNYIRILVNGCKSRMSKGKRKYQSLDFDITKEFIKELYLKQDGKCAISKIPMTYIAGSGKHITNVSIDRIDSNKGYTKDNVQLVCSQVNMMKSDLTFDELLSFCKSIVENNT